MSRVFIVALLFLYSFLILSFSVTPVNASLDSYNNVTSTLNCPKIQIVNGDPDTGDLIEGRAPLVTFDKAGGGKLPEDQRRIYFFILVKNIDLASSYDIVFEEFGDVSIRGAKPVLQSSDFGTGQQVALLYFNDNSPNKGQQVSLLVDTTSYSNKSLFSSGPGSGKKHFFSIYRKVNGTQVGGKYCEGWYNIIQDSSQNVNTCKIEFDPKSLNENTPVHITGGTILPYHESIKIAGSSTLGYPGYRLHIQGPGGFDKTYGLDQNKDGSLTSQDLAVLPSGEYTRYLQKGKLAATEQLSYEYADIPVCSGKLNIASEQEVKQGGSGSSETLSEADGTGGGINPTTGERTTGSELTGEASKFGGKACVPGLNQCAASAGKRCLTSNGTPDDAGDGILTALGCIPTQPQPLIKALLRFSAGAGGGIALLLMVFGSFRMMTSAGNPESVKKGQDQFSSAIIGLLFIIFSVLLLQIIGVDILNLPGFSR